jgi:acetoin utilization deacetylase AcuC-like enzyme
LRAFYTDRFVLPLPDGHRFPMVKYARLRERCLAEGILEAAQVSEPEAATWEQLALAHDREYLARVRDGELSPLEQRRIGFPWSGEMVERSRRSVGATIEAGQVALAEAKLRGWGITANLAGGTHHAHSGHGEGFCVFNDAAVATRVLQSEGKIARAAIIDCDVHQGNGTAAIFSTDPSVLTFSIHGSRNYPFRRERSSIDVDLPDGTGDEAFLCALDLHVPRLLDDHRPDLVIYLAGADPFRDDRYGRLSLSKEGLAARDSLVLDACRERAVPIVVTMAGGYGRNTEDTVDIHVRTLGIASAAEETAMRRAGAGELPK